MDIYFEAGTFRHGTGGGFLVNALLTASAFEKWIDRQLERGATLIEIAVTDIDR